MYKNDNNYFLTGNEINHIKSNVVSVKNVYKKQFIFKKSIINLIWSNQQLTIDRGTNHAGESSEKCEQTKCRCEVVQPGLKENKLK